MTAVKYGSEPNHKDIKRIIHYNQVLEIHFRNQVLKIIITKSLLFQCQVQIFKYITPVA